MGCGFGGGVDMVGVCVDTVEGAENCVVCLCHEAGVGYTVVVGWDVGCCEGADRGDQLEWGFRPGRS